MQLLDSNVVVAGGTGRVGEGLVKVFLSAGARVFVPVRSTDKQERLEDYVTGPLRENLRCIPAHIGDEDSVTEFRHAVLDEAGSVDLAVACIGGWYYGYSMHRMPFSDWSDIIESNLTTHFLFMRAFLSILHEQNGGSYVLINGGAADIPVPDSGPISVVAAAQKMMGCVLAEEAHGTDVRVFTVEAFNPLKTRRRGSEDSGDWLSAEQLGEYVLKLHTGSLPNHRDVVHTLYSKADLAR
jgi:NAD(P)-dependent dehydrogenase (short-subunit alcohol dehydrogenase family)